MTSADVQQLVRMVSSDHIMAFFLVLARITPLFIIAPVFSSRILIARVRGIIAVGLAIGMTPVAAHGLTIPTDALDMVAMLLEGLVVGFAFAYAIACVFAAVQGAGTLTDFLSGFSYGASVDPINGNSGGSMTNLYTFVGLALFLAIGGDAWMLRGIEATFKDIPLTHGPRIGTLLGGAESMFGSVLVGAIEVAAPVMLALVITDIAFGMVSKVVPQLNVFAVGFPVKVGVAIIVVGATLPFIGGWITGQLDTSVGVALHSLRIA